LPDGDATKLRDQIAEAKEQQEKLRADVKLALERQSLERQLSGVPEVDATDVSERMQRCEMLIEALQLELERANQAAVLDRQIADIQDLDADELASRVTIAEDALDDLEAATTILVEKLVKVGLAQQVYHDLQDQLDEVRDKLDKIAEPRRRVHVLNYSIQAAQKIKRKKLHQVVESIRDCLPRFASTMFSHEPNTRFVVASDDESLDLICQRHPGGGITIEVPVKGMSGGEKQRLSVALLFTLHALLHARKRPDLLILDEVDRGLDDVGIASLMSLVRGVRNQYGTVIMTSHRAQIAGAAFDRTWRTEKKHEVSCLTTGETEC
jgi:chromosome segregation ATPase